MPRIRKLPQKAIIKNPEPFIVKINPADMIGKIILPEVKYELQLKVDSNEVFEGVVLPIPSVLIYYLNHLELKIVSYLMENPGCECGNDIPLKTLTQYFRSTHSQVYKAMQALITMGLITEFGKGRKQSRKFRKINYKAIQHLADLVKDEDTGVFNRIRKATCKTDINSLTKEDIHQAYDQYALPPGHDPAEEEEYD